MKLYTHILTSKVKEEISLLLQTLGKKDKKSKRLFLNSLANVFLQSLRKVDRKRNKKT